MLVPKSNMSVQVVTGSGAFVRGVANSIESSHEREFGPREASRAVIEIHVCALPISAAPSPGATDLASPQLPDERQAATPLVGRQGGLRLRMFFGYCRERAEDAFAALNGFETAALVPWNRDRELVRGTVI